MKKCIFAFVLLFSLVLTVPVDAVDIDDISTQPVELIATGGSIEITSYKGYVEYKYSSFPYRTSYGVAGCIIRANEYSTNSITVSAASADCMTVEIRICGIEVRPPSKTPLEIQDHAKVSLEVEGSNKFTGPSNCAAILVSENAELTIQGTGSLTATGGYYGAGVIF